MDINMWLAGAVIYIIGTAMGLHYGWKLGFRKACEEIVAEAELHLLRAKVEKQNADGERGAAEADKS